MKVSPLFFAYNRFWSMYSEKNFFFTVLGGKAEKRQNTFFGYKKWYKIESRFDNIFKSATPKLYIFHFLVVLSDEIFSW